MPFFGDSYWDPPLGTELASYFGDWWDSLSVTLPDGTPPSITLVSPEDFSGDFATASTTPVVIDVTDADPGLSLVTVVVTGAGFTGAQVVYYNGTFFSPFTSSTAEPITDGLRFSILPESGWDSGALELTVTAVDSVGNIAAAEFEWAISAPTTSSGDPGYPFRDSTWRWRRRLNKQKCSVISIAIDDNSTPGPGFTLTALALEIGRKPGLDRVPWRGGTYTNRSGSSSSSDGTD